MCKLQLRAIFFHPAYHYICLEDVLSIKPFHSDLKNTNKLAERFSSDSYNFILTCGTNVNLADILRDETIQPRYSTTFTHNILFSVNEYFVF